MIKLDTAKKMYLISCLVIMIAWTLTNFYIVMQFFPSPQFGVDMNTRGEYWLELLSFFFVVPGMVLMLYNITKNPRGQIVLAALALCLPGVIAAVPTTPIINYTIYNSTQPVYLEINFNSTDEDTAVIAYEYLLYRNGLLVANVSAIDSSCYQETANVSTVCGGLDTGTYSFIGGNLYINYSRIPTDHIYWMVRHGPAAFQPRPPINISLPDQCTNLDPTQVMMYSNTDVSTMYCYNSTAWVQLRNYGPAYGMYLQVGGDKLTLIDGDWSTGSYYWGGTWGAPQHLGYHGGDIYEEGLYHINYSLPGNESDFTNILNETFAGNITIMARAFDGSDYSNWSNISLYIQPMLYNCSSGNIAFTLFFNDESYPTNKLASDLEYNVNYTIDNATFYTLYGSADNITNQSFCISPANYNFTINTYFHYSHEDLFTHRYYMQNVTISNATQEFTLYNLNTTAGLSDLKITARQASNYQYYPGILAKMLRFYVSEGIWRVVQMDRSGDYGLLHFNIIEENIDYKLVFLDANNNILKSTDSLKFICTAGLCDTTINLNPFSSSTSDSSVDVGTTWNQTSKILSIEWTNPELEIVTQNIKVTKPMHTGTITICSATQTGVSGNYDCNLSVVSGTVKIEIDGSPNIYSEWFTINSSAIADYLSEEDQVIWSVGLIVTAIGAGLFSPVTVALYLIVALVIILWLQLFNPVTLSLIIIAAVVSTAIGLKVRM